MASGVINKTFKRKSKTFTNVSFPADEHGILLNVGEKYQYIFLLYSYSAYTKNLRIYATGTTTTTFMLVGDAGTEGDTIGDITVVYFV